MKRLKLIGIIGLLGGMLFTTSCGQSNNASKDLTVKAAAKQTKNTVEASGVVKAANIENIQIVAPQGSTIKITKFDVKEGQKVKKGDKLVELDMSSYNSLISSNENNIEALKVSKKDLQTDNAKKAQDLKISSEQVTLDALRAEMNKSYLSDGNIISDMDNAVVTELGYKQGDLLNAAEKVLCLQDLNSVYIQANIREEFIKDVAEGRAVTITPTSDPSSKLTGKVTRISSAAVTQNGETNIPVEISIDNNNGKLLPNYNVDVEISKK